MRDSSVHTLAVPTIGAGGATPDDQPSRLWQSGKEPTRVMVRNVGGTIIFIAHDSNDLANVSAIGAAYQMPGGAADIFVLAPGQSLFAASQGSGGSVSIAVSEAFPTNTYGAS